jgi:general secretion pathway protein A
VEHLHHFGLTQDPFSNEPDLRFYFESTSHFDAQRRVERGLRQRKGLTLLTGDGGMGKTLLARRILDALEEEVFEATLLVMLPGAADATGILQRFARQLGAEEPANDRAGLLGQIYEQLAIVREDGRHTVLMVDDAQIMSPEVFAELGGLLNLEYEDRRLLSILFVGSPDLDRLVENDPSMAPRVDVRVRLQPMDMSNVTAYLGHRLDAVKGNAEIVPANVIETLVKLGRGRPRLLNTLADNALFEAYLSGRNCIDPSDVERAAADLGIGPDPGSTFSHASKPAPAPAPAPMDLATGMDFGPPVSDDAPLIADDLARGIAEFELTPEMATEVDAPIETLDLDAGLESALEEFGTTTSGGISSSDLALGADALQFDIEPPPPTIVAMPDPTPQAIPELAPEMEPELMFEPISEEMPASVAGVEAVLDAASEELFESELILEEVELSPLEAGEADQLDDLFVELIEE